ncbi:MAG: hypothetical protein LUC21_00390, partial [Oscillospiraceae bacterium]|nr:hypothetical protein [Oscillospiraceae bacterium]
AVMAERKNGSDSDCSTAPSGETQTGFSTFLFLNRFPVRHRNNFVFFSDLHKLPFQARYACTATILTFCAILLIFPFLI